MVCAAWLCDSWIFSLGSELFIFSLLTGFGAVVNALMRRIWRDAGQEAATAVRGRTTKEPPIYKTAGLVVWNM